MVQNEVHYHCHSKAGTGTQILVYSFFSVFVLGYGINVLIGIGAILCGTFFLVVAHATVELYEDTRVSAYFFKKNMDTMYNVLFLHLSSIFFTILSTSLFIQ